MHYDLKKYMALIVTMSASKENTQESTFNSTLLSLY